MQRMITRHLGESALARVTPLAGLTGQSQAIECAQGKFIARPAPQPAIPFVDRQREYRLLNRLHAGGLTAKPLAGDRYGLLLAWQQGEAMKPEAFSLHVPQIVALLRHLHQQPLTGYRLKLLPLLWQYWQRCRQRNLPWLQALQRLTRIGEPSPLRLAPLHMDVHAGNIIVAHEGLHLIDWEYAADGDIALELAAVCAADPTQQLRWLTTYAQAAQLPCAQLQRQVNHWQPWLRLLMASWYQLRAEQSGEKALQQMARESWEQI